MGLIHHNSYYYTVEYLIPVWIAPATSAGLGAGGCHTYSIVLCSHLIKFDFMPSLIDKKVNNKSSNHRRNFLKCYS